MTIGIAVHGPDAARAALAGLRAVEAVGRGAIGGFVSLSALSPDRRLVNLGTQRGGAGAALSRPELDGLGPCRLAVLMSSGPDRPEPLTQFTPGDPAAGLMTGHRLPNMPGPGGEAPNLVALGAMGEGAAPEAAIELALSANPSLDAGLIAMSPDGRIALANSRSVAVRDDIGAALVVEPGLSIGILHNSIFPHQALADLAVSAIRDRISPLDAAARSGPAIGLEVLEGDDGGCLLVDPVTRAMLAFRAEGAEWRRAAWEGCPVRRGDPVLAGGRVIGHVVGEAYCVLRSGRVTATRGGAEVSWTETVSA